MPATRRLGIGVLDADVFQASIDKQAKDATMGLRVRELDTALHSAKSYIKP